MSEDSIERKSKAGRTYPRVTLQEALRISTALKDKNAGNPWAPEDIASAAGIGKKTGKFFYLTAGARDYGLTEGTSASQKISLTELGKAVAYPASPESEIAAKTQAFTKVPVFRQVLNHYRGNNLPEMEYLSNTLKKEFGVP